MTDYWTTHLFAAFILVSIALVIPRLNKWFIPWFIWIALSDFNICINASLYEVRSAAIEDYLILFSAVMLSKYVRTITAIAVITAIFIFKGQCPWLSNPSIAGAFCAIVASFQTNTIIRIFLYSAAVFTLSSSAALTVAASIAVWKPRAIPLIIIAGIAACHFYPEALNPTGRMEVWKWSLEFWKTSVNHLTGSGFGTFGPIARHTINESWTWMHSDLAQITFETGYIGIALFLTGCAANIKRTIPILAAMLVSIPFHIPLLTIACFACIVDKKGWKDEQTCKRHDDQRWFDSQTADYVVRHRPRPW